MPKVGPVYLMYAPLPGFIAYCSRTPATAATGGFNDLPENQQFMWLAGGLGAIMVAMIVVHGVLKSDHDKKLVPWGQEP